MWLCYAVPSYLSRSLPTYSLSLPRSPFLPSLSVPCPPPPPPFPFSLSFSHFSLSPFPPLSSSFSLFFYPPTLLPLSFSMRVPWVCLSPRTLWRLTSLRLEYEKPKVQHLLKVYSAGHINYDLLEMIWFCTFKEQGLASQTARCCEDQDYNRQIVQTFW